MFKKFLNLLILQKNIAKLRLSRQYIRIEFELGLFEFLLFDTISWELYSVVTN